MDFTTNDLSTASAPAKATLPGEQRVFFGRDLPPLGEVVEGEHTIEADSPALPIDACHDALWDDGSSALQTEVTRRIEQELLRLGGSCAHVVEARLEPKVDYATGKMWLHGRYAYVLYHH